MHQKIAILLFAIPLHFILPAFITILFVLFGYLIFSFKCFNLFSVFVFNFAKKLFYFNIIVISYSSTYKIILKINPSPSPNGLFPFTKNFLEIKLKHLCWEDLLNSKDYILLLSFCKIWKVL